MQIAPRVNGFGNISEQELKNIQTNLLDLLLEFDAICKKHNITYYLDGGSALGAMRHGGFIPWDDDIDLLIKRSEFNKLMKIIDSELELHDNRIFSYMGRRETHHHPFARYVNTTVPHIIRNSISEAEYPPGIFIDIFILDPVPASRLTDHTKKLERSEEWFHKRLNGVVGRMPYLEYRLINGIEKIVGEDRIFKHFNKQLSAYNNDDADYYIPRNGFNYAVYEADVFQTPRIINFEGHKLPIPTKPEKFLRTHYSIDWYLLPPANKRYSEHLTLTSDCFTVQDFMDQFDWTDDIPKIHKVQQKRHKYQILRRKPYKKTKKNIATINALADEIELDGYLESNKDTIKKAERKKDYAKLAEIFEPFYERQMGSDYREFNVAINVKKEYLISALTTLIEAGRFYDAERILSVYKNDNSGLTDIRQRAAKARQAEITEQDDPKRSKPIIKGVSAVPSDGELKPKGNDILDFQIKLLNEIQSLCKKHSINYTLTDNLLLSATLYGNVSGSYTDATIAMTPNNYRAFISLTHKLPKNRTVENIYNNEYYPNSSTRYIATDTTSYHITAPWYKSPGIHVSIRLLAAPRRKIYRNLSVRLSGLVRAACVLPKYVRWVLRPAVWVHGRYIKNIITSNPTAVYFGTTTGKKHLKIKLEADNLKRYELIQLNGKKYQIFASLPNAIFTKAPWAKGIALRNNINESNNISRIDVPFSQFISKIPKTELLKYYYNEFTELQLRNKIEKVDMSDYSHRRYLFNVAYNFYRYKLHMQYLPIIDELNKTLASKNYKKLEMMLKDYIDNFNYFFQYSRVMAFDPVIFRIYLDLLKHQGKADLADYIAVRVKPEDYCYNKPYKEDV